MPVFSIGGAVFVCTDLGSCSIGNFGTKDHHLLTGLGDDDHTQYYNATRHTKAIHDSLGLDHGSLSGKGDYDHDQYLRKNGSQAMTGDLNISTFALKTTNLRFKEYTSLLFAIRNAADDDFLGLSLLRAYFHVDDSIIRSGESNVLTLYGGENYGAIIQLHGKNHATDPGEVEFQVPNAAKNGWVVAMDIKGVTDTPIAHFYHGLNIHSKKITDVVDPTANQDAATKKYVDDNIPAAFACSDLSPCSLANLGTRSAGALSSGTLALARFTKGTSGHVLEGQGTGPFNPPAYVNPNGRYTPAPHDHGAHTGLSDYDHDQYLRKNGAQAMTGNLNLDSNALRNASEIEFSVDLAFTPGAVYLELVNKANSAYKSLKVAHLIAYSGLSAAIHKITDVVDPTANQDAATKKYVDDNVSGFACADLAACSLAHLGTRSAGDLNSGTLALARFTKGTDGHVLKGNGTGPFDPPSYADPNGLIDHGSIGGLTHYDHDQYLRKNGAQAMTGNLSLSGGSRWITATAGDLLLEGSSYVWSENHFLPTMDNGYVLGNTNPRWAHIYGVIFHEGDVAFAEKECIKCDKKFKVGDNIVYKVIRFDEDTEEPMAIPIHLECANSPPKKVKKSYAVTEDYYVWDEEKGEAVKRRRNKAVTKKVKKRKIKESNFEFDDKKGEFWKLKKEGEGKDKKVSINEATEEIEEELKEVVYEDKEFFI